MMEEIEVFCTSSLTTGENVKLFLEDELLGFDPPVTCNNNVHVDGLEVEELDRVERFVI